MGAVAKLTRVYAVQAEEVSAQNLPRSTTTKVLSLSRPGQNRKEARAETKDSQGKRFPVE
jgi:hypothetical protein